MYELIKLTENNYYIYSPAKIGLITLPDNEVIIIDSGNDKDAGKKIKKHLDANNWTLKAIFNTHSHADHIGGNDYLQKQTGCKIYAYGIERDFTCHPILEPGFLYGGNPPKELRHKFLMAQPSNAEILTNEALPNGVEIIKLQGHSFDMVGFKTNEGVIYLADCLSSAETLEKYKVSFLTDVEGYLQTLEMVKNLDSEFFVPAHAQVTDDIKPLAQLNIDNTLEIGEQIIAICKEPQTFETLLKKIFEVYNLKMTFEQHALVGSTIKSYLTWLKNSDRITAEVIDNKIVWKSV